MRYLKENWQRLVIRSIKFYTVVSEFYLWLQSKVDELTALEKPDLKNIVEVQSLLKELLVDPSH